MFFLLILNVGQNSSAKVAIFKEPNQLRANKSEINESLYLSRLFNQEGIQEAFLTNAMLSDLP